MPVPESRVYPQNRAHHAQDPAKISVAVVTVSDTRTLENDTSGDLVCQLVAAAGHRVASRRLCTDDAGPLKQTLKGLIAATEIDAILTTGGTGISPRDQTPEVVAELLDVELTGFGERFRAISVEEIGEKAMLSRAIAGRAGQCVLFSLPGSTGAVRTGISRCVLPVLSHAVALTRQCPRPKRPHE